MIGFSSIEAANREGFVWLEYSTEYQLHVVQRDWATPRGRVRALGFARPSPQELATAAGCQATS